MHVSPALAELLHTLPADRFPRTRSYGTIGAAGLASPDELVAVVAVVGRAPGDAAVSPTAGERNYFEEGLTERAPVSGFSGTRASVFTGIDRGTVLLGVVLLVMPVVGPAFALLTGAITIA